VLTTPEHIQSCQKFIRIVASGANNEGHLNLRQQSRTTSEVSKGGGGYLKAVSDLLRSVGTTTQIEYERLSLLATAPVGSAEASKDLELETYQHGC